ncbi:hypothetical protein G6F31_021082 [Rhizopus arrhizus]|nr:hypothetical protein G6F31_021082 [Rhizopus arrhizus]
MPDQAGEWAVDQFQIDPVGIDVGIARGEALLHPRETDQDSGLHAVCVAGLHLGAATPRHELGVLFHVGDQIEHLGGAVRHQDGSLYFVHRLSQMARMARFYRHRMTWA